MVCPACCGKGKVKGAAIVSPGSGAAWGKRGGGYAGPGMVPLPSCAPGVPPPRAYEYNRSDWAGVPLISTAARRGALPLARLALHARGAPLVQTRAPRLPPRPAQPPPPCPPQEQDACLPRIIKPRKRRKKDRKPEGALLQEPAVVAPATGSSSAPAPSLLEEDIDSDDSASLLEAISRCSASACLCRYCDPASSSSSSSSKESSLSLPSAPASRDSAWQHQGPEALRRSWSEPWGLPLPRAPAPPPTPPPTPRPPSLSLQVSSHIVTSLNGHRDLEIRFFSARDDTDQRTLVVR